MGRSGAPQYRRLMAMPPSRAQRESPAPSRARGDAPWPDGRRGETDTTARSGNTNRNKPRPCQTVVHRPARPPDFAAQKTAGRGMVGLARSPAPGDGSRRARMLDADEAAPRVHEPTTAHHDVAPARRVDLVSHLFQRSRQPGSPRRRGCPDVAGGQRKPHVERARAASALLGDELDLRMVRDAPESSREPLVTISAPRSGSPVGQTLSTVSTRDLAVGSGHAVTIEIRGSAPSRNPTRCGAVALDAARTRSPA